MAGSLIERFFASELDEHEAVIRAVRMRLMEPFTQLLHRTAQALNNGHKILLFGNGGSAADAQHIATELTVRYSKNRPALAAIALTTDTSALTAIGNDMGFEYVFARQIDAIGRADDIAIGISTSGRSRNVVLGLKAARDKGLVSAALTGGDAGELPGLAKPLLVVPSYATARIQEVHIMLGHMLCSALERELDLI